MENCKRFLLETPFSKDLDNEIIREYRQKYINYRQGEAHGAQGELEDVFDTPIGEEEADLSFQTEATVGHARALLLLTEYRINYRHFRVCFLLFFIYIFFFWVGGF
eukprot:GHVR01059723.1.p1 GENE.GHVR01059723.1~~GHVR01059723.1.p1  ORF type:complete len:106 (+),score=23.50 GHVR01059723.1:18-335(+)